MKDRISGLWHHCYEGMLRERHACKLDVEKTVSL